MPYSSFSKKYLLLVILLIPEIILFSLVMMDIQEVDSMLVNETIAIQYQQNEMVDFSYLIEIRIFNVDYASKTASVFIYLGVFDFPYSNVTKMTFYIDGDAFTSIECEYSGEGTYWGKITEHAWPMVGSGEMYPFDSYLVNIILSLGISVEFPDHYDFLPNTNATLLEEDSFARLSGSDLDLYRQDFEYIDVFTIPGIQRDPFNLIFQLLLPIFLSYFLIGGSILIKRSEIGSRLRIYTAIFIFAPTFLFTIQSLLPYRLSLCIPEILLVNALTSAFIFTFASMIPCGSVTLSKILDITAVVVSGILITFLFWIFSAREPDLPATLTAIIPIIALASGIVVRFIANRTRRLLKEN